MCYKVRRLPHTNPLFPAIIRTCVFYLVLLFLNCLFFWNLLFSFFYFNELAFYEKKNKQK